MTFRRERVQLMRIIHTADLHIGSTFGEFEEDARRIRKVELVDAFRRLVDYANANAIENILLAGDIFDKDKVNKTDKDYFYQIIEANSNLNFYYLKGNHDINSAINKTDIPNLYLFNDKWQYYEIGEVVIAGLELTKTNAKTLFSTLNLNKDKYNIVMLHGDTKEIPMSNFKNKAIDYMALGHLHSYSSTRLDARGVYVYSGCLEGRGFDELGEKGFVVIDTETKTHEFIPFATRKVYEESIDITGTNTLYDAIKLIETKMNLFPMNAIVRTIIFGKVDYSTIDLESRLLAIFKSRFMHYEVKNKATKLIHLTEYEHDISLRGEVIRTILAKGLPEEQQNAILDDCLKLLNGEDIEL